MRRSVRFAASVLAIALALIVAAFLGQATPRAQQTSLSIDADPSGNSATTLGPTDPCVRVATGSTFQVDLFVRDVVDLLAWSVYLEFDPQVVRVVDRDVQMFQAANPGSNVVDASAETPNSEGLYSLGAVDTADPPSPDSGSGVLARITLEAVGKGISPLRLAFRDLDGDGDPDQGPFLRNVAGQIIGDETGDTFFDGPIEDAQVAVGERCPGSEEGSGERLSPAALAGIALAIVLAAIATGLGATSLVLRRRGLP